MQFVTKYLDSQFQILKLTLNQGMKSRPIENLHDCSKEYIIKNQCKNLQKHQLI